MCYFYGDFAYLSVHSRSEPYDYAPLLETSDHFQEGGVPVSFKDCMLTVTDCPVSIVAKGR